MSFYNPYQQGFTYPYQQYTGQNMAGNTVPTSQNTLPHQQVIQVNGKASVDQIQLAPNSSVLVMDTSAPIVWLCVSDGVGRVTSTPYDITEHKETPPVDMQNILERVAALEGFMTGIMNERMSSNHESNASASSGTNSQRSNNNGQSTGGSNSRK